MRAPHCAPTTSAANPGYAAAIHAVLVGRLAAVTSAVTPQHSAASPTSVVSVAETRVPY